MWRDAIRENGRRGKGKRGKICGRVPVFSWGRGGGGKTTLGSEQNWKFVKRRKSCRALVPSGVRDLAVFPSFGIFLPGGATAKKFGKPFIVISKLFPAPSSSFLFGGNSITVFLPPPVRIKGGVRCQLLIKPFVRSCALPLPLRCRYPVG